MVALISDVIGEDRLWPLGCSFTALCLYTSSHLCTQLQHIDQ